MRILRGSPALSEFRINKLLELCRELSLPVTGIYAEFAHFADLTADLDESEVEKLEKLLTYGPTIEEHEPEGYCCLQRHARALSRLGLQNQQISHTTADWLKCHV